MLAGYLALSTGAIPMATDSPNLPLEKWAAGKAIEAHLRGSELIQPPFEASPEVLVEGAQIYKQNCVFCHGQPTGDKPELARGMFPPPPMLLQEGSWEVGYPPGSVHRLIHDGIRLSGMPAFKKVLTEKQIWQVTLMLAHADRLPPEAAAAVASE